MTAQTHAQQILAGIPTVGLPWGHGDRRQVVSGQTTRDGWPIMIGTDSPDAPAAITVCGGVWPWHLLCQAIRVPVLAGLPDGITVEDLADDGRRLLVTGPGGRIIIERGRRTA